MLVFLTLPQKALEAILLLHNQKPDWKHWSTAQDIPIHRLMDFLQASWIPTALAPITLLVVELGYCSSQARFSITLIVLI